MPEFSFGQFAKLIEDVGYVREVTVFTIKTLPQHVDCRLVRSYYSAWYNRSMFRIERSLGCQNVLVTFYGR